jgi:hypothetical protein
MPGWIVLCSRSSNPLCNHKDLGNGDDLVPLGRGGPVVGVSRPSCSKEAMWSVGGEPINFALRTTRRCWSLV